MQRLMIQNTPTCTNHGCLNDPIYRHFSVASMAAIGRARLIQVGDACRAIPARLGLAFG
jgi:hypothetical protein